MSTSHPGSSFLSRTTTAASIFAALSLLVACGPPNGGSPDAGGADAGVDATGDAAPPDATGPSCEQPESSGTVESVEYDLGEWIVANGSNDQLGQSLRNAEFELPEGGSEQYGLEWQQKPIAAAGDLPTVGNGTHVAATNIEVNDSLVLYARADAVARVWVNGLPQPGDVYAFGDKRIAIPLESGTNSIVVQYSVPARGTPQFEAYQTNADVYFNAEDMTAPELRVGTSVQQPLGLHVVNQTGEPIHDLRARVVENDHFESTTVDYPAVGADAVTQIGWRLKPKGEWEEAGSTVPVTLELTGCDFEKRWQKTVELTTVEPGATFRRTFWSPVDRSVQYYAVVPPSDFTPGEEYGVTLALHGATVEAKGHATSYSRKDWTYIVAPTNRRRFGFDWEEWGRLNGIAAMDHFKEHYAVDETRQYVTGHSMGGHGSWHFAAMHPNRFAALGPSAGWASFYTYGSPTPKPEGPVGRARAHSDTFQWLPNLRDHAAYILHGSEDQNVPPSEGKNLRDELRNYSDDVQWHLQEGADHWWDGDRAEGTDCVDWPGIFETFQNNQRNPTELEFEFDTPGPWYSAHYSYVRIRSSETPLENVKLVSSTNGDSEVALETTNVRSMNIDGAALTDAGIETLVVDGDSHEVTDEKMVVGPESGKGPGLQSTLNQAFRAPFCFVYPADGAPEYRRYASYLLSTWSLRGNGHGCAVPHGEVDAQLRDRYNLIFLGVPPSEISGDRDLPFGATGSELELGNWTFQNAAGWIAFPHGDWTSAAVLATEGAETRLYGYQPFSSRSGMPDYLVLSDGGAAALGFFGPDWSFDASLGGRAN